MKSFLFIILFAVTAFGATKNIIGDAWLNNTLTLMFTPPSTSQTLIGRTSADVVTNKSMDATTNSFTNIGNSSIAAAAAISYSKFATLNTGQVLAGNGGVPTATTITGDASIGATGTITIANLAVTNAKIATGVALAKLATTTSGNILVGSASGDISAVAMSGDAAIASTGTLTLANTGVSANTYRGGVTVDTKGRVTAATSSLDISTSITGTLPVANGGTARTTALFHAAAAFTGANFNLGTSSQATKVEMTSQDATLTPISGSAALGVMCATTQAAATPSTSATTCGGAGTESNGISFTNLRTGLHRICAQFAPYAASSAGAALLVSDEFEIINTPTNAQTLSTRSFSGAWEVRQGLVAASTIEPVNQMYLCADFSLGSVTTWGFRLMYSMAAATAGGGHLVLSTGGENRKVYWTVDEQP